jgi:hypothetical protein
MFWSLSRFRVGSLVEVRSQQEILATLDSNGCVDGMPFMPEMLKFCGLRFRVSAVAHKTCDTARKTWKGRRLKSTLHLEGLRCDGSAHGGCEADCNLFWKDVWLKPVKKESDSAKSFAVASPASACTINRLHETTQQAAVGGEPRYSCQTTKLYEATEPLAWWDIRQYVYDVVTGNHTPGHVSSVLYLASLKYMFEHAPIGYQLVKSFRAQMHRLLTGRDVPDFRGAIPRGKPTPSRRLDLKRGERVRIKSKEEIVQTIDEAGNNRGLCFDVELVPFCGRIVTVRNSVTRILDEQTGEMRQMKQPCITLEGVTCNAEYSECRLLCPRSIPSFWREDWLERVDC